MVRLCLVNNTLLLCLLGAGELHRNMMLKLSLVLVKLTAE